MEIAQYLKEHGVAFCDAPVSGGVRGASAGTLTCMYGGEEGAIEEAMKFSACFAKNQSRIGPVGAGHATKAINNISSERMVSSKRAGLPQGDRGEARSLHRRRLERPQQEVTRFESVSRLCEGFPSKFRPRDSFCVFGRFLALLGTQGGSGLCEDP